MIVIHLTVSEAAAQANGAKSLMEALQASLVRATGKPSEEIAISGGLSDCMTAPYAAMMDVEFHSKVTAEEANAIAKTAATALSGMLSKNLVQRAVIAHPSIRGVLPPVRVG